MKKKNDSSKGKLSRDADVKGFKQLIKRADTVEFERLARMELENTNKLVKVLMQNSLSVLSKVDPEGYEIYHKKGMLGLMQHFVTMGTMTRDEYNAWKSEYEKHVEEFNRIMKLYLKEAKQNPEFREQGIKEFK